MGSVEDWDDNESSKIQEKEHSYTKWNVIPSNNTKYKRKYRRIVSKKCEHSNGKG